MISGSDFREDVEKLFSVCIVPEHGAPFISPGSHVVDSAIEFNAQGSGHGVKLSGSTKDVKIQDLTLMLA